MLILCIGPDTFRAQAKARELEKAFRAKHDASGASIERLSPGKDGIEEMIERANTVSLFSPRRFMRLSNLVSDCPKNKQGPVTQALSKDPENVIVVSVEEEPPTETAMKAFKEVPKIIKYEFPKQQGAGFKQAVYASAAELGLPLSPALERIVRIMDGDTWGAWNELLKLKANGEQELDSAVLQPTVYEYADRYLLGLLDRFRLLNDEDAMDGALSVFVSQSRSALRVRDRATDGLHPYVVRKMGQAHYLDLEQCFAQALAALFSQRAGYETEQESALLF